MPREKLPWLVAYHHRNPVRAGVVELPRQSTWTSHRAYLRVDPAPPWLDVECALDILGFEDTARGRQRFDEFVTDVDLRDLADGNVNTVFASQRQLTSRVDVVDWAVLTALARQVTGLSPAEPLNSTASRAVLTRRLLAIVATRDLGQTYADVAAHLQMRTGSVFNLVARPGRTRDLQDKLDELRKGLCEVTK